MNKEIIKSCDAINELFSVMLIQLPKGNYHLDSAVIIKLVQQVIEMTTSTISFGLKLQEQEKIEKAHELIDFICREAKKNTEITFKNFFQRNKNV